MAMASVADELRRDHDSLRQQVAALEPVMRAVAGRPSSAPLLDGTLRQRLSQVGAQMDIHFRREEEGLFPDAIRVVAEGSDGADTIGGFLHDEAEDDVRAHTSLRTGVQDMLRVLDEAAAAGRVGTEEGHRLEESFRLFRTVLELHAAKEDGLIFPMIESALSPSRRSAVLERLRAMPLQPA